MAVSKVQLLRLMGPVAQFDRIVMECVMNREFHPEEAFEVMQAAKRLRRMDEQNPYADLLARIKTLADIAGVTLDFRDFGQLGGVEHAERFVSEFETRLYALKSEREEMERDAEATHTVADHLAHLRGFGDDIDVHDFFNFEYVRFRFGRIPVETYEHFISFLNEGSDFYFFESSRERDFVYGAYFVPTRYQVRVDTLFASLRFERIILPGDLHGSADIAESELEAVEQSDRRRVAEIDDEIAVLLSDRREGLLAWYSLVRYSYDAFALRRYAVATDDTFFLYGWIPDANVGEFRALLDGVDELTYKIDSPDIVPDITPPTKLKNLRIFKRFEPFVSMYGLPAYNEVDPTPLMGIAYTLIFGIMFGDVGQGLLIAIIGALMWRFKKNWLGRVLVYAGIAGAIVGLGYGSVFGFEDILPFGFHVLESADNTGLALQYAVLLGVGVLTVVMGINVYNGLRQRDYEKALFGQNGLAGMVLFFAVMLVLLPMLGFLDVSVNGAVLAAIFLVPLALVVFRHPLGKLLAGETEWFPKNFGAFLVENLFELIEIFLAYVTSAVSFVRIGIFIISHAAMMNIVFMLAGGHENPNMVVVVLGNLFVMGLEGLLVGIQVLRLNFYEMFGKFYAGGGREFAPLTVDYKNI